MTHGVSTLSYQFPGFPLVVVRPSDNSKCELLTFLYVCLCFHVFINRIQTKKQQISYDNDK